MKRALAYIIPVLILAGFIWIMNTDALYKRPISVNLSDLFATLQTALVAEDWTLASDSLFKTVQAWNQTIPRIQWGSEKNQIANLSTSLSRIAGSLIAKDKAGALAELGEAKESWSNIGK